MNKYTDLKFTTKENEKYSVYTINEDKLTTIFAPAFKTEVLRLAKKEKSVICDIKEVDYIDSSGLSSLLIGDRLLKEFGCRFILCHCSEKVINLIRITKLESIFTIVPTLSEAKDFILLDEIEKSLND